MKDSMQNEEFAPYILSGYGFDGAGGGKKLREKAIGENLKASKLAWVHLDAGAPQTRGWLEENAAYLDDIILDALFVEETRPRVILHKDGLLVILRGVNLNEGMDPEDMISIRMWIDPHRIISLQRRRLRAVEDICSALEEGRGPKDSGDFIARLTDRLLERMEPVISGIDERCDDMEEAVLDAPDMALRHEIIDIRRSAIVLRRHIVPQRDVIATLRSGGLVSWLGQDQTRAIQESYDRVMRYVEELDTVRERAQIVKDELSNILSDRINKNMYVLSIVAAIFLPLGFVTGLLGINVGGMPGADSDIAFWIVCLLCTGFAVSLLSLFRFMKWL
jgi:zinc transporter